MSDQLITLHPKLSKCNTYSKTSTSINIKTKKHPTVNDCHIVNCQQCHSIWYVCTQHTNRFSSSNRSKMIQHFKTLHPKVQTNSSHQHDAHINYYSSDDNNSLQLFSKCSD